MAAAGDRVEYPVAVDRAVEKPSRMKKTLLALLAAALAAVGLYVGIRAVNGPGPGAPAPNLAEPADAATPRVPAAPDAAPERRTAAPATRELAPAPHTTANCAQGVRGIVVDGNGAAIAGVQVFLQESVSNDPVARLQDLARDVALPPAAAATTDEHGAFALGLSQPSSKSFEVLLLPTDYADERIGDLLVRAGDWVDLGKIALDPGHVIRGRVTIAGTGLPVPQAVVALDSGDPFLDVGLRHLSARNGRSTRVDLSGRYTLEHAPRRGIYRLTALAPGFARQLRDQVDLGASARIEIDFELLGGLSITGRLLGNDGQAIGSAHVEAWPAAAEPAFVGQVESDGRFQVHGLREGPHRLRVVAAGYQTLDQQNVAAGSQDLQLQLERRGSAAVVVRAPDGHVLRDYRLALRQYFAESGGQIGAVHDVPDRTVKLGPQEDAAVVSGLEPGAPQGPATNYVFQVEADDCAKTLSAPFTIDPFAPPRIEMTMTLGGTILGRVVDETGQPVAGATVATQAAGAVEDNPVWRMLASLAPDKITRTKVVSAADGSFRLPRLAHAGYQLEIGHPEFCRTQVRDLVVLGDVEQTLPPVVLRRGTLVRGRAFADDRPRGQVCVVLTPASPPVDAPTRTPDESALVRVEAVSDNDGFFTLPRRVPPGVYELRARLQAGGNADNDVFLQIRQMQRSATVLTVPQGVDTIERDIRITN